MIFLANVIAVQEIRQELSRQAMHALSCQRLIVSHIGMTIIAYVTFVGPPTGNPRDDCQLAFSGSVQMWSE